MHLTKLQRSWAYMIAGSFLFCLGLNMFITPINLYTGGLVGLSMMIRTLIEQAGFVFKGEISGYINFMFNIPLLLLAYKNISKHFFTLTLGSILLQTVFFAIIPVPKTLLIDDILTSAIIGAVITGYGIGLVLRSSGSGGGIDILGIYLTSKFKNFSVGKLNIIFNTILFSGCMIIFDFETAIYSILYVVLYSFCIDKAHHQNVNVTAMIITKSLEGQKEIMTQLHRGITYWNGYGAYTKEDTYVMITAINKYEINVVESEVLKVDPHAFIIYFEGMNITGNFEKHL